MKKTLPILSVIMILFSASVAYAQSEADERFAAARAYEMSDELLNTTYQDLMKVLGEEEQARLLKEQRQWIVRRDNAADKAAKEHEGSNYYNRVRNETMTPITVDRYAELLKRDLARYAAVIMANSANQ
jgi:uncharacterized protein YecT (DUF1311 family)